MTKTKIVLLAAMSLAVQAMAQITLPEVKPFRANKKNVILGTYGPKGLFAQTFPNFLHDGKYYFDVRYPEFGEKDMSFGSKSYPADMAKSSKTLNGFRNIFVYVWINNDNVDLIGKQGYYENVHRYFWLSHGTTDKMKLKYGLINATIKHDAEKTLINKWAGGVTVMDYDDADIRGKVSESTDLIFDVRIDDRNILRKGGKQYHHNEYGEYFPGYVLYTMVVRNRLGEPLASYSQAVFVEFAYKGGDFYNTFPNRLLGQSFPAAFESLINRFLNDDFTAMKIIAQGQAWAGNDRLTKLKVRYGEMQQYKPQLQYLCNQIKANYSNLVGAAQNSANTSYYIPPSTMNTAAVNNLEQSLGTAAGNLISVAMDAAAQRAADKQAALVKNEVAEFNRQLAQLVGDVKELPETPGRDEFLARIANEDNQFADIINEALAEQQKAGTIIRQNTAKAGYALQNAGTAAQNYSNNGSYPSDIQPVSAAATNGGGSNNGSGMQQCASEATAIWKSRTPYQKTLEPSPLQADVVEAKADMIDVMVEHCGQYMSPSEKADYRNIAAQTHQEAQALRNGNTFKWGE